MTYQYKKEVAFIKEQILAGADLLKGDFDLREKSVRDVVTSHDLAIEKSLTEAIRLAYPEDVIISEEGHQSLTSGHRTWVIDPIDGTTNYSRGIPLYGIQLAFLVDGAAEFSVIYYVKLKELYLAMKGQGAYCNGQPIHVGQVQTLDQAIISFGDFSTSNEVRNTRMLAMIKALMNQSYKLKIHGSACMDMLFLASGRTDAHIMSANHPWDFLPGLLLVKEAGGLVDEALLEVMGLKRTLMVVASTKELYDKLQFLCNI